MGLLFEIGFGTVVWWGFVMGLGIDRGRMESVKMGD